MRLLLAIALAACGAKGASPSKVTIIEEPEDPEAKARRAEREQLEADEPVAPYETRSIRAFKSGVVCGQGPYRIPAAAIGARFGEKIDVKACVKHLFEADYRFTRGKESADAKHFGWGNDDTRCTATASELARSGATSGSDKGSAGPTTGTAKSPTSAPAAAPAELVEIQVGSEKCPEGTHTIGITGYGWQISNGRVLEPGMPLVLDLWSHKPIHLEGAIFIVHQSAVRSDLTPEAWAEYRRQYDAWYERYRAFSDRELASGRSRIVDNKAHSASAPPPARAETQPPRPSTNAAWVSGYWHRDNEWIWVPGFWRVPEEDIVKERTVEAPQPPPAARTEAIVKRPTAVAVWTPGYWAWDCRAYVWIEGAWRIPPSGGGVWVAPTWRPRGSRVVFVPGGWSVRVRR